MLQTLPPDPVMYKALVQRDAMFEGVFFVGVTSTSIFCRPTCPARKPKPENVMFYGTAKEALDAGYRPCKRCRPMEPEGQAPEWLRSILAEVENDPTKRWKDRDLEALGIDANRLRRWFKKNHGMTFQGYLRARRLGLALGRLQHGAALTQTAFEHGYESLSGFSQAMKNLLGQPPARGKATQVVYLNRLLTPLGPMLVGATERGVCLLEFADRRMLETQLKRLVHWMPCTFVPGSNAITEAVAQELEAYFAGALRTFRVPLEMPGTDFQQAVWQHLLQIPYGQTRSYGEQARLMGKPTATRAVARANGDNRIAILIPCHRVIGKDGRLRGYGGSLWRKKYLLELEQKMCNA